MRRTIIAICLVTHCCVAGLALAEQGAPDDSGDIAQFVNGIINESVNANTLFASQESIATGRFSQRQQSQPDKDYTTIRLPGEVVLGDKDDVVRPVFTGNGALLRTTAGFNAPDGIGEADFTVTSLFALSGGVGTFIKLSDSLTLAPLVSLTYSHIKNRYDFNNDYSQNILQVYDSELFNWTMDVFTYTPALKALYQYDLGFSTFNYEIAYSYLFNDTISDDSASLDINSSTGLCSNRIDLFIPTGLSVDSSELFVRPMFQWNNISGSAVAGLGLRDLYEMGADTIAKVADESAWISTITVGASYVTGDSFEGYHLGAGVTF